MAKYTNKPVLEQIRFLRNHSGIDFGNLLDPKLVEEAIQADDASFRDRVFSPCVTLWTFLTQVQSPEQCCRAAVARLIASRTASGQKGCSANTSAYCKARKRLAIKLIIQLVRTFATRLEQRAPTQWLWKGREVRMVDGATLSMPDTPENQSAFPQSKSQAPGLGFPVARIVALISLATGAILDIAIGPCIGKETGETALLREMLSRIRKGTILLGDRYFASYFGIAMLADHGVDGLFRMHQLRKYDFRLGTRLGICDHVVKWVKPQRPAWMPQEIYDKIPETLAIRELRVIVQTPGFRVDDLVLVTTLLDPLEYSKDELGQLYFERWNVELDLRSIKSVMQMDVLRCESPDMVVKEIWVHVMAYDLVRGVMAEAAGKHGKEPRDISFAGALQTIRAFRDTINLASPKTREILVESMIAAIASHRVGNRPGRVEPRAVKRRPKQHALLREPRQQARNRLLGIT